jgi:hypothetical protein
MVGIKCLELNENITIGYVSQISFRQQQSMTIKKLETKGAFYRAASDHHWT